MLPWLDLDAIIMSPSGSLSPHVLERLLERETPMDSWRFGASLSPYKNQQASTMAVTSV